MSFLLRKVEDVTTISKSQSLTSVSIKDCTLRDPNETTILFLLRVVIDAYIVCHEYIDTCIYLFVVHLDIILLVVSDRNDSTKLERLEIFV